jgi:hypothetical protein
MIRNDPRWRALALGAGLIPPRTMNSAAEMGVLSRLASGARRVVELGVYEGSSAVVLCRALGPEAELHLVDPFLGGGWALRPGWQAHPAATRRAVRRAAGRGGPVIHWHLARSQDVGRAWTGGDVDLVFIDGDHTEAGCERDWLDWSPRVPPGRRVVFHDARDGRAGGRGLPGPTAVVERYLRPTAAGAWEIEAEADRTVVARRIGPD